MHPRSTCLALLLALAPAAHAQSTPSPTPISVAGRHDVIDALARQLQAHYVFPDVAATLASSLRARDAGGAYATANDVDAFAKALTADLQAMGRDLHFHVAYDPGFGSGPADTRGPPSREDAERLRQDIARHSYGIDSVRRLPGNVGYIEVRGFGPAEYVGDAMTSAMKLLAGTDALILDLRRNGGGEPDGVACLLSHFFAEGDSRHLNDIYSRTDDSTRQYWTDPSVTVRYTRPVYVLTSRRTFSGGEEAAYDLQTQKRATLVGETTGGGANPGEGYALAHGFAAFIPNGRSINPVTHANWEHTGVQPDIAVPAAEAQTAAHVAILQGLIAANHDAEAKADLQEILAKVAAGIADPPVYTLQR